MKRFRPQLVAVRNESLIGELREALADADYKPEIVAGENGVVEVHRPMFPIYILRFLYVNSNSVSQISTCRYPGCAPP